MKVITAKELKETLNKLPNDTIIALQSDSEGNETSTCLDIFIERVGQKYQQGTYSFIGGNDIYGINQEQDKDKFVLILQPSL